MLYSSLLNLNVIGHKILWSYFIFDAAACIMQVLCKIYMKINLETVYDNIYWYMYRSYNKEATLLPSATGQMTYGKISDLPLFS